MTLQLPRHYPVKVHHTKCTFQTSVLRSDPSCARKSPSESRRGDLHRRSQHLQSSSQYLRGPSGFPTAGQNMMTQCIAYFNTVPGLTWPAQPSLEAAAAAFVSTLRVTNIGRLACSAAQGQAHAVLLLLSVQSRHWCTAARTHTCSTGGSGRPDWLLHAGCEQLPCQSGYTPAASQSISAWCLCSGTPTSVFGTPPSVGLWVFSLLGAHGFRA